ncbi:ASCH domain-containing protein [Archaeoglobales archaeon]|nr:MAG: ASCH domain-containing protein [Archaeoglobales archaeon]
MSTGYNKIKKHLEFKNRFKKKILNGEKTATLRLYTNLKEGDLVYIHCGGSIIGIAEIEEVVEKSINELSDEDARLDGFKDKEELLEELKKFYGLNGLPDRICVVKFKLRSKLNENPYVIYYGNVSLIEIAEKALRYLELDEYDKNILRLFLRLKSVRKVAFRLGGLKKRGVVRRVLRECYRKLKEKDLM